MRRRVDATLIILLTLVLGAAALAAVKDPGLPLRGLAATARLFRGVWLDLLLGFLLAGLVDVLVPQRVLLGWLGGESLGRGILIGWGAGLAMPGGPYVFFPVAANLFKKGAAAGPLITLLTAKTLVSPVRTLTYEAPLLGWPLTLARFVPGVLLPPLMGLIGHWLYSAFEGR
jgi:uncharacterized membrane protein YraQ (UPF0718 family)